MLRAIISLSVVTAAAAFGSNVGGTKDSHGCNPSTGYTWCSAHAKCERPWMTPCPSNEKKCAVEGGKCACNGQVRYGKVNKWSKYKTVKGSIACNNAIFGDSVPGTQKECVCKSGAIIVTKKPTKGNVDAHGCKKNKNPSLAYTWCETHQKCEQPWITPCPGEALEVGDICYRYNELDASQGVNRRRDCPTGSKCQAKTGGSSFADVMSCQGKSTGAPTKAGKTHCVDMPFQDSYGNCAKYKSQMWCMEGKTGPSWDASWGKVDPKARKACCACGGGRKSSGIRVHIMKDAFCPTNHRHAGQTTSLATALRACQKQKYCAAVYLPSCNRKGKAFYTCDTNATALRIMRPMDGPMGGRGGMLGGRRLQTIRFGKGTGSQTSKPSNCTKHSQCAKGNYCDNTKHCWECASLEQRWCDQVECTNGRSCTSCCTNPQMLAHCPFAKWPKFKARCGNGTKTAGPTTPSWVTHSAQGSCMYIPKKTYL